MLIPRLWIREPSGSVREQALEEKSGGEYVIGRDESADIVLADHAVSRHHARLIQGVDGQWKIVDLGSSNRTFVNEEPVLEATVGPGDRIGIGDCELHLISEIARQPDDPARTQVLTRLTDDAGLAKNGRGAVVLGALYKLTRELTKGESGRAFLERALQLLTEELQADRGAALLLEGEALVCRAAHSRGGQALRGFVLSQTIYREVMQSREAVLSRDTGSDARFQLQQSIVGEEIRSILAAPLRTGDKILGILYLDRLQTTKNPFVNEDLHGAALAAEILGAFLEATNALTGLQRQRETLVKTLIDTLPIVGVSKPIQRVREFIRRAAPTTSTVLILGETGTGKELVARAIHYQSSRRGAPFVAINCAAIPDTLVESELFGHEKGAFTGASERKIGKFELGDQGTVFLDEIAELPLACQSKLLRLLEERCLERVGGTRVIPVDVRIVAATNRDLAEEVKRGTFRDDLYYRLNVLQVRLPPLRERTDDIPILIDHFLDEFGAAVSGHRKNLSADARTLLLAEPWPGNIRQLRNAIESGVVLSLGDVIEAGDLPLRSQPSNKTPAPERWAPRPLAKIEQEHIERVLNHVNWNKSKAAELLGIERSTLYARIKSLDLKQEES